MYLVTGPAYESLRLVELEGREDVVQVGDVRDYKQLCVCTSEYALGVCREV